MAFVLHPQLAKDCIFVCDLAICRVLLMNHAAFPWLILVPMREDLRELTDISAVEYPLMMEEVRQASLALQNMTGAYKMNVAALGNMVAQLHIHIVARFENDAAWPNPVWNSGVKNVPYSEENCASLLQRLQLVID